MAGVFPGCNSIDEFWSMLKEGRSGIVTLSDDELRAHVPDDLLKNPFYVRRTGRLTCGIDLFDHAFFGVSPREASLTDPQHRLLLENVYRACEDAAINLQSPEETIGCFVAASDSSYYAFNLQHLHDSTGKQSTIDRQMRLNNMMGTMATKIAFYLDLTGAAINIQTACSSGLVALQVAMDHLRLGRCTVAIVGTSCVHLPTSGYLYEPGSIYSPIGRCAPFDESANGIVLSDAVCAVVLKLAGRAVTQRHHIYALVKSCAVNNNGTATGAASFAAPNAVAQAECIREALTEANVNATDIAYVEAHGTGTAVGDPIEVEGLTQAFDTFQRQYCILGSVKSNVGHSDTAAGLVGLIKTALVLQHRYVPATLNFGSPNPNIDFASTPFVVRSTGVSLETPRYQQSTLLAAVSSLGMGGTNAHAILQEYRQESSSNTSNNSSNNGVHQITLSSKTLDSLRIYLREIITWLKKQIDAKEPAKVENICYTLNKGRSFYEFRSAITLGSSSLAILISNLNQLSTDELQPAEPVDQVVFIFPGQHKCSRLLARQLYSTSEVFKKAYDLCAMILEDYDENSPHMIDMLMADDHDRSVNQEWQTWMGLTTFMVEFGLITLWCNIIRPPYVFLGHSIGEYVVAVMTGVFTLEEALKLVFTRTCLINQHQDHTKAGAMLAVRISYDVAIRYAIDDRLSIAAVNGPMQCVFAGDVEAIDALKSILQKLNYKFKQLEHAFPFHSHMVTSLLLDRFRQAYKDINIHARSAKTSFISTVTGEWYDENSIIDIEYWCRHMRQTVLWYQAIKTLDQSNPSSTRKNGNKKIYIECSLGNILINVTKSCVKTDLSLVLPSVSTNTTNVELSIKSALSTCWCYGLDDIDFQSVYNTFIESSSVYNSASFISMPGRVFNRQHHWIDPPLLNQSEGNYSKESPMKNDDVNETKQFESVQIHTKSSSLIQQLIDIFISVTGDLSTNKHSDFFASGGDSHTALIVISRINHLLKVQLTNKDLMEMPVIEQLAARIEQMLQMEVVPMTSEIDINPSSNLSQFLYEDDRVIIMKKGISSSQPPIFVIAPTGGTCFIYRDLCKYLNKSCNVLALKYPDTTPSLSTNHGKDSVINLASYYIGVMRSILPDATSYILLGTSFGGMVGYEMSQQLSTLSSSTPYISRLFMIDTPTKESLRIHLSDITTENYKNTQAIVLWAMFGMKYNFSIAEAEQECMKDEVHLKQFCIDKKILSSDVIDLDAEFHKLCHYMHIFEQNMRAIDDYFVEPLKSSLTEINFIEVKSPLPHDPDQPHRLWSRAVPSDQFNLFHVDGNHLAVNFEPYVEKLASLINKRLLSNSVF
ncbi:unnamed protein product [Rotaria magnacalcarata]|uniref:oleoyl-[acyl-carrier-protein] hydrolase n=1 Tax=Rotaria magnacalcarata TaxID=392030 RepID=A0A816SEZ4_9BILA|nr:unnamed protein product [Rotaria magnacalcarata]CAF4247405.1 unnamed protein product [Rotaria magnacalcarata]